ncbi:MAG: adenylate kinase family protein [Candidatus Woesearchaeota archaeon]
MKNTGKKKVIIVTGTPGTGKTETAKKISKIFDFIYVDVNKVIKNNKLSEGIDKKRKTNIIDTNKLAKALINLIQKSEESLVIDSHLSHFVPNKYVDLCIVTKCDLNVLEKRLKKRSYGKGKVRENLDAEIFDICYNEAKEKGHKILVIDTSKRIPRKFLNPESSSSSFSIIQ